MSTWLVLSKSPSLLGDLSAERHLIMMINLQVGQPSCHMGLGNAVDRNISSTLSTLSGNTILNSYNVSLGKKDW